jgi:adenosylmethionine-8-amino-7-oxononanoate aminotransferase
MFRHSSGALAIGFGGRVGDRRLASEHEGVIADMPVLDKGLIGRYVPLAITLISEKLSSGIR